MVAAFCLSLSISAQDSYYYYHGTKMPLSEDATQNMAMALLMPTKLSSIPPVTEKLGCVIVVLIMA